MKKKCTYCNKIDRKIYYNSDNNNYRMLPVPVGKTIRAKTLYNICPFCGGTGYYYPDEFVSITYGDMVDVDVSKKEAISMANKGMLNNA